ncbi:TonB-dependent receptor [Candidatus Pseudothioglobus singularis]|nr:TonB-dependent receptor [Candidatus Pseudothioglobus singularis]MDC0596326.1 TonB-dependent receptor [Candidatus Pseudothioglobus singularis]
MFNKKLFLAVSFSALVLSQPSNAVIGPIKITLNPTELSSNYFNEVDTFAPFSSEVYTQDDIKNSKATNIYDFLSQNTSLSLAPSSGNRFSKKISARGYGLTIGSHNLVVTLNGRRLNNIDTSGPEIAGVDINDIERVEITKGSGSVIYGDSAMAGAIHFYTKKNIQTKILTTSGNYGVSQTSASVGINDEKIDLNISLDNSRHDGFHKAATGGVKDKGKQTKSSIGGTYTTDGGTEISLDLYRTNSDIRYPNYLSDAQFEADPTGSGSGSRYTYRDAESSTTNFKVKRNWGENFEFTTNRSAIDKESRNFYSYSGATVDNYKYDYKSNDYLLTYTNGDIKIDSGVNIFDGKRTVESTSVSSRNTTSKENLGVFSQLQYFRNASVFTVGARSEKVDYKYSPESGTALSGEYDLNAFDIGINTSLSPNTTIFTNYNHAFQAPLIDRFFISATWPATGQVFNGFVRPSKSRTFNIGLNHLTDNSKTKLTLYRSNIKDEMFLCKSNAASDCGLYGDNLNLDKSHKQGLELQNKYVFSPKWSTGLNYAYTIAKIDSDDKGAGALNGKTNPMTSKHNISASVIYSLSNKTNMTLTQKYRSEAFAEEDYANIFTKKQPEYNSTNFNFSYNPNDDLSFSFDVENLFENSYGTRLRDDVIYPGNSTRNIKAGLTYKF